MEQDSHTRDIFHCIHLSSWPGGIVLKVDDGSLQSGRGSLFVNRLGLLFVRRIAVAYERRSNKGET
jgi:hypothetical protein